MDRTPLRQTRFGKRFKKFLDDQLSEKGSIVLNRLHTFCVVKCDLDLLNLLPEKSTLGKLVELVLRNSSQDDLIAYMNDESKISTIQSSIRTHGLRF